MYNTPLRYGSYVYPRWGKALGVCIGATCCLQIVIWAVVAISKETGTLKEVSITSLLFCHCEVRLQLCHTYYQIISCVAVIRGFMSPVLFCSVSRKRFDLLIPGG